MISLKCCVCTRDMVLINSFSYGDYGYVEDVNGLIYCFECTECGAYAELHTKGMGQESKI